ncbi:MAG: DUF3836 domain-containing protein [Dysgonomonas sp.]
MKAAILTSVLVAFLSVATIFAQGNEKKVLTNIEQTESGSTKELTYLSEDSSEVEKKVVYHYDLSDNLLDKTDYKWDSNDGWVPTQKYEYEYNAEGKVSNVTLTKWDSKKKRWDNDKSKTTAHVYNNQGELMAVR